MRSSQGIAQEEDSFRAYVLFSIAFVLRSQNFEEALPRHQPYPSLVWLLQIVTLLET